MLKSLRSLNSDRQKSEILRPDKSGLRMTSIHRTVILRSASDEESVLNEIE